MPYLNCPRCRITVRLRADAIAPEHCPRCERKHGVREAVFLSSTPSRLWNLPQMPTSGAAAVPVQRV